MIENVARHARKVDHAMRSPYLKDLEDIGHAYDNIEGKHPVSIDIAYQSGNAVY